MERDGRTEWLMPSLVVRNILKYLSNPDILSLSLVNKIWNFEAKSSLKIRGRTGVRIGTITLDELVRSVDSFSHELWEKSEAAKSGAIPPAEARAQFIPPLRNTQANACEDVINFARLIESMVVVPFRKLNFQIRGSHPGPCVPMDEDTFRFIIDAVPVTSLSISVLNCPEGSRSSCQILHFLPLLFRAYAHQLKEILIGAPTELTLDPHALLNTCDFPLLKSLVLDLCEVPYRPTMPEMAFLNAIVRRAPNLQFVELGQSLENHARDSENNISFSFVEDLFDSVLQASRAILILPQDPADALELPEHVLNRLAVRYVNVLPPSVGQSDLDTRADLLQNSWWMLREADFEILSLAMAFRDRIPFPNLRELSLGYTLGGLYDDCLSLKDEIMKTRPWSHSFPYLQKLTLHRMEDEHWNDFLFGLQYELLETLENSDDDEEEGSYRLGNLQELHLRDPEFDEDLMSFLCNSCSNIRRFSANFSAHLGGLWTGMPHIEFMELDTTDFPCNFLEWILCGVSEAEFAELQKEDVEYLKNVHIVPRDTPITHLKHLKILEFHFRERQYGAQLLEQDGPNFPLSRFSKISAGLCFSRMPNLTISIRISRPEVSAQDEHGFESILEEFPEIDLSIQMVNSNLEDD